MLQIIRFSLLFGLIPVWAGAESFYWGGQRPLSEITETSSSTLGNFGYGRDAYESYRRYTEDNGCSAADGWRPCSMSDIREAYANRVTGWDTIGAVAPCSWVNGYDPSVVTMFDPGVYGSTNCNQWNDDGAQGGLMFCPASGASIGFTIADCSAKPLSLLCCR